MLSRIIRLLWDSESAHDHLVTGNMTVADMPKFLFRILAKLFPVQPHEWPKAFLLFSVATLWGMSTSVSRAASEGMFLSHLGVEYLPTLLLANPLLVLVLSIVYSAYADRLAPDRLMIVTVLLPVPLIVLFRLVILLHLPWVYFLLYAFVLAYGALIMLSWSVYLATHYDIQEAKRLIPFISSGLLLGTIMGGMVVVGSAALLGPANLSCSGWLRLEQVPSWCGAWRGAIPASKLPKPGGEAASRAWGGPLLRDFTMYAPRHCL
jgi:ATP/ADP translocase